MSKLPHNTKISKSQVTQWEVIKNCEYADNCLSKIVNLYVIKMARLSDFYARDEPEINTILARISVTSENVFLNKAAAIEIMEDIFPQSSTVRRKTTYQG
ncbi:MAG: hypothetical protein ACR5K6_06225 [Wolbachia sp.]